MIDIRCSRDGLKCGGCPIIKECEHIELTEEIDAYSLYEKGRADQKEEDNAFFNFEGAWELEKKKVRANAINNFVVNAITEFQKFDKEHGYPTLGDISDILSEVAEQLKDQI